MSEDQLKSKRTGLIENTFFQIPGREKFYFEKHFKQHPYFDGVGYGIKDGKLSFIGLEGPRDTSPYPLKSLYKGIVEGTIAKYGHDYRLHVADGAPHPQPDQDMVFQWDHEAENTVVTLTVPTLDTVDAIMAREPDVALLSLRYSMSIYNKESILAPIFIENSHSKHGNQQEFIKKFMEELEKIDIDGVPKFD